jgi:hypothetical protein
MKDKYHQLKDINDEPVYNDFNKFINNKKFTPICCLELEEPAIVLFYKQENTKWIWKIELEFNFYYLDVLPMCKNEMEIFLLHNGYINIIDKLKIMSFYGDEIGKK